MPNLTVFHSSDFGWFLICYTGIQKNSKNASFETVAICGGYITRLTGLMYTCASVTERDRIATSRLRLGSHSLRVETGRWSRTPRENRLCICDNVQDEIHVLLHCPLTHHLRHEFPSLTFQSIDELMTGDPSAVTTFCRKVLETYVWNNPLYSIARPFHL